MNMYCLIFVCSSLFGTSTVDQATSNSSAADTVQQQKSSVPELPRLDLAASMKYSEPQSMSLPEVNEELSRQTARAATKGAGPSRNEGPGPAVPLLLSEMLLPPKSVRSLRSNPQYNFRN